MRTMEKNHLAEKEEVEDKSPDGDKLSKNFLD
jgi:hypothetical protein